MNLFSRLFLSRLFTRPHATHVYTKKIVFVSWSLWSSFLSAKTITKYIEKWMKVMYSPSQGIWNLYRKTFFFFNFSWRLITLQYCSGFCHTLIWISHGFTCGPHPEPPLPPPSPSHPSGSSQCTSLEHLSQASNLDWWSVSHMIIYIFQCYSLRSSHPCLLPQNPKDCSIHLCLICCLTYMVIIIIFLNSIYMC